MLRRKAAQKTRILGAAIFVVGVAIAWYVHSTFEPNPVIEPQLFQSFNPIFIVFLTPVIIGFFIMLRKKGKEPSSPKKIGIGMFITGLGSS
ncbi:MAG: hypothetical protein U5L09_07975 [Bacteroidales bacterium]|nr:hypothetical protein [Bacteroidales bacterium]